MAFHKTFINIKNINNKYNKFYLYLNINIIYSFIILYLLMKILYIKRNKKCINYKSINIY